MAEQKKVLVLSEPDDDSCAGSWMYLKSQRLKFDDVDWFFVRSGTRASEEEIASRIAIHIDTGMRFDGIREFDHHQDDPTVREECATTLVYQSFYNKSNDPDGILQIMATYIRLVDHGLGKEGFELIRDSQFDKILRDLSAHLHAFSYTLSKIERIRVGHLMLDAFYEAVRNEIAIAVELGSLERVNTPFGTVLFGETVRAHKEVRAFVRRHWYENTDVMILHYGDGSVGVTLIKQREYWRLNLKVVRDLVLGHCPNYTKGDPRVFLHPNGYVFYVHADGNNEEAILTLDDLFDIVREAHVKS